MPNNQVESLDRDLNMMKNPNRWPRLVLPLTRGHDLGILLGNKPTVYKVNMYMIPDDLSKAPQESYPDYEAVVAAGWQVD
jgi:hypothetical protein